MSEIIRRIREELISLADSRTRESGQNFFKEQVRLHGVKTAMVTAVAKAHFQSLKGAPKAEILSLCEELWQSGFLEESFIACHWSYSVRRQYEPADFEIFEQWISAYINNWASCDTFCNHTVGELIERFPELIGRLRGFTVSTNRWVKRAAAVSLIVPARKGKFLPEILEIADLLLTDTDDLVQKGYGWMLKVASQKHEREVFEYVLSKKDMMPRTALRYAIEKMPEELKIRAMERQK